MSSTSLQRLGAGGHLLKDIDRYHRRRVTKRLAQLAAVVSLVLLAVWVALALGERRTRSETVAVAQAQMAMGTSTALEAAVAQLEAGLVQLPDDPQLTGLLALVAGHAWLEFDAAPQQTRAALTAISVEDPVQPVAVAMLAFADGAFADGIAALDQLPGADEMSPMLGREAIWLRGHLEVTLAGAGLTSARAAVDTWVTQHPDDIAMRRLQAHMQLHAGAAEEALATLAELRQDSPGHMGLAADDALYHAVLRTKLAGVASVADQLFESEAPGLSRADRAHAVLARAVVHAHSGERDQALRRLDEAWESLAPWNTLNRRLAIETSLEAGDATRIAAWVEQTRLPQGEGEVFIAWGVLLGGDVMEALRLLAALPQSNPRVGYLQALALVEQGRWAEAQPWITRTETLLPGRVEIEVARARTEVRLGDALTALGKLTALAEFEPYAPRAWTGLGEAHLLQEEPNLDEAERALQRAVEREPVPADALLMLATVATLRDPKGPKARLATLRLLERATEANARLPKFGEALALHLAELGLSSRARKALEHELDRPGAGPAMPLALAGVLARQLDPELETIEALLQRAEDRSAPEGLLAVARAQLLLLQGNDAALTQAVGVIAAQLAREPSDVVAHSLRVRILLAQRDFAGAETALRRGLAAVEAGNKGRLYFEWARLESKTGRRKTAAPRSRRAWVELLTEQRDAWVLLDAADLSVRMWLRSKMERVATTIAQQLTDRLSYHSRAWTIRARAQLAAGEAGDACNSADKAVALDAEDPQAHEVRGDCLLRFGSRDKAKASYERAVSLAKGTSAEAGFRKHLRRL